MDKVFIYWDNSNIFLEAQRLAEERNSGPDARYRVRIDFTNMLRLAHADRPVEKAHAAGSVPPEMRQLWNRLEGQGVEVQLFTVAAPEFGEGRRCPTVLQLRMLEDALDYNGDPGIAVLLTGDGAGYQEGAGFHRTLERMHGRGWRVEIMSWAHFLQSTDAPLGPGEWRVRRSRRLLRLRHVPGAVRARPPSDGSSRVDAGLVTAYHRLTGATLPR